MRIRAPKLPKDALQNLRPVPAELWEPYRVLVAPVYVYLPRNEKFVAVKTPLQYFTEAELQKFRSYNNFYLPEFVEQVEPFRKAGEQIRTLLVNLRQSSGVLTTEGRDSVLLPLAQHEIDRTVLEMLGGLWSVKAEGIAVEPFFLCFFANEVCLPFPASRLEAAAGKDADLFELALLRASTAVFLALHVGYAGAEMLSRIRERVFEATMTAPSGGGNNPGDPYGCVERLVFAAIREGSEREISISRFHEILAENRAGGVTTRKLLCRLARVSEALASRTESPPSLFGEKGICDG